MDLLSCNKQGRGAYMTRVGINPPPTEIPFAIKSAADEFYVIAPGQTEVVVPFEDSGILLDKYRSENDIEKKRLLLRRLGRYSVSMYAFQLNELSRRGAISETDGIKVLTDGFYNKELGIDINGSHTFLDA